jgi:crotonobetainyl-CoA:carnitine CoA-transferase CaiB-like acyl-CoA transferase
VLDFARTLTAPFECNFLGVDSQPPETLEGAFDPAIQPLTGVRVLDLTDRIGAYCSKLLADLGADVLKVELPTGDRLRFLPPHRDGGDGPESGLLFAYYHHNKRGITLNWQRDDAEPLLRKLASSASVVLASPKGSGQTLTGFIESPPSLSWVTGNVLTCFITPFGLTGPYREWRATPFTLFAMSGYMYPIGPPEGPPLAMPGQQFYDEAGIWAAFLIQSVLRCPAELRSQVIDHSVHEMGLFNKLGHETPYSRNGDIKSRVTNFGPPPSGIWKCNDGFLDVGAHSPHHWDIFVDLMGRPEILSDPIYRERGIRIQLFDLLTEMIAELLATRSARELVELGQSSGLPCALMQSGSQFVQEKQPRERGFYVRTERKGTGSFEIPGAPFLSSPVLIRYHKSAPVLGEANEEVFVHDLGYSTKDLERWRSNGLI